MINLPFFKRKERQFNENKVRNNAKKIMVAVLFSCLILYGLYAVAFPQMRITWINVLIFSLAICGVGIGLLGIIKKGVTISNVFTAFYFLFLAINNLNISKLQSEKTWDDINYFFTGAIIFLLITGLFDRVNIKSSLKVRRRFKPNSIALILLVVTVGLKIFVFLQTGIRLVNADWSGGGTGGKYLVGGLSGLAEMSMWLALMLVPQVKRSLKVLISAAALILFGIFSISRNNIMMTLIFLVLCFAYSKHKRILLNKKTINIMGIIAVATIIGFSEFGNYRQIMRGWSSPGLAIATLLKSNVNNSVVNWTYSYTAINFDVMLQIMANAKHPFSFFSIAGPIIRLFSGSGALTEFNDLVFHHSGLNGFNASTLFGPMIYEMGSFYFIQALMLGLQVGIFAYLSRMERATGHYIYLMSFSALAVFGNYYSIPIYFYISIAASVLFLFIGSDDRNKMKN